MASTFKSTVTQNIGTTATTVYTCPSATQTTMIGLSICNTTGSGVNAEVTYTKGGTTIYLQKNTPVPVGGTLIVVGGDQKVVLEAANYIQVKSDTASSLDVATSILELT